MMEWNKFGNKISVIQRHLYVLIVVVTFQECFFTIAYHKRKVKSVQVAKKHLATDIEKFA
jgi:hypothetical protein